MNQHQKLPPATVDLSCDECGDLIATLSLQTPHFLSKLYDLRREHAKTTHGWQEGPEDANAPNS